MASFNCKVMTPQGQIARVRVEEENKISCLKKLKRNGMTPISIKKAFKFTNINRLNKKSELTATVGLKKNNKKSKFKFSGFEINFKNKVTTQELIEFTQDFYFLKQSKFTSSHALITIINKTENEYFKKILRSIQKKVDEGSFMYKEMKEYDKVFPIAYVNLIKTGELTKNLNDALKHALSYLKDEEKINEEIKEKIYPAIYMFVGIILTLIISTLIIIPNLQNMFMSYGNEVLLPPITVGIFKIVSFITKYWYMFVILITITISIIIKNMYSEKGRMYFDKLKYNNFFTGKTIFLLDFLRVIKSLSLNLNENMKMQYALEITKNFVNNSYMLNIIEKSINNVYTGKSWIDPFEKEKNLNTIVIEMLKKSDFDEKEKINKTIEYLEKDIQKEKNEIVNKLTFCSYGIVGITLLIFVMFVLIPCIQIYLGGLFIL